MIRRIACFFFAVAALALPTGCRFGTGSTSDVRREVTRQTGVELEPEFGIKLGRLSTALAKPIVRMAADHPVPMRGVAKVEVGVYRVVRSLDADPAWMGPLDLPEWQPIVRVREGPERVQILVQADGERIRAMLVLVLDGEEFVVVRMRGNLHRAIPRILEIGRREGGSVELHARG